MNATSPELLDQIIAMLEKQHGNRLGEYAFPPPVFTAMQGKFLDFDSEQSILSVRFPVLETWLNPYGIMQGGMVAAAVDNTLGPLSMLVAPPNVTRRLQMKYSQQVTPDLGYITVKARLLEREGRWLAFSAEVRDPEGALLARAQARHWIVDLP